MEDEAYAGRWVARINGKIVGQGGTPDQARFAASRHKENPDISFMPFAYPIHIPRICDEIIATLPSKSVIYLVGGAVRDLLSGRKTRDLDFALPIDAIGTARRAAKRLKADFYILDPQRDTARVLSSDMDGGRTSIDFASFRGPDLEDDLRGRDFTINAVAIDIRTGHFYDPLGGVLDLKAKLLRSCSPSALLDDPIRILRGVRLAAALSHHIQEETREAMIVAASRLSVASVERVRDELFRMLEGVKPSSCIRAMEMLGVLDVIMPEIATLKGVTQSAPHVRDVWEHTLALMTALEKIFYLLDEANNSHDPDDFYNALLLTQLGPYRSKIKDHFLTELATGHSLKGLLFLSGLYHDVAKPSARTSASGGKIQFWNHDQLGAELIRQRGIAFAFSNEEIHRLEIIVRNHMRIRFHANRFIQEGELPSRRSVYRFFKDVEDAGIDLCLLALADLQATYGHTLTQETWSATLDVVRIFMQNYFEKPEESIAPPAVLDGNILMKELGLPPGPQIGLLLETIREAQATGKVSTRGEALSLARSKL